MANLGSMANPVKVRGLKRLRRDLRLLQPEALKTVRLAIKGAAEVVAVRARATARSFARTGTLAAGYKAGTTGNYSVVRNREPYAGVHEFGGLIAPRGTPFRILPKLPIYAALDSSRDEIEKEIMDGLMNASRVHGWRL